MKIEHKKLEVIATLDENFTQAQYETYQTLIVEKGKELRSATAFDRILIEAAQEAKIITVDKGDVTRPAVVKWLSLKIHACIGEAVTIPPE